MTLALCVKVTRADLVVMGFTSHDLSLVVDGVTYESSNGFEPTTIRQEASRGIDSLEIFGLLSSDAITEEDLVAGLYDGASFEYFYVNWEAPEDGRILILTGWLGEVTIQDGQFQVEVRSLSQRLEQNIGELYSKTCRVRHLGDVLCQVDINLYRHARDVVTVNSPFQIRVDVDDFPTGYYDYGQVTMTSGLNDGVTREIKRHTYSGGNVAILILQEPFPYEVEVGDSCITEAGCDRKYATCRDKFDNLINFQGEPFLPGNDQILKRGRKA